MRFQDANERATMLRFAYVSRLVSSSLYDVSMWPYVASTDIAMNGELQGIWREADVPSGGRISELACRD